MFGKYKNLILAVVIIALAFAVYHFFFANNTEPESLIVSGTVESTNIERDIVRTLNQLNAIKLDSTIFDDEILNNLIDKSIQIGSEPIGKESPFDNFDISAGSGNNANIDIDIEGDIEDNETN